ncbi:hypothetical protein ACHAXH_004796 [Discostella pseudostelligera]
MSVDPSHFLPAANGGKPPLLKLQNISARPELNGKFGQAVSYSAGRYVVAILDASATTYEQQTFLKLKPENLIEAGNLDQLRVGAQMLYQTAISYISSPSMQERGQNIISMLPPNLQHKMTPTLALLAAAIAIQFIIFFLFFVLGRIVGFSKIIVFISLVGLLLAVSSPDWIEGYKANKPLKLIATNSAMNFRRRWKDHLVAMTGYAKISDTMALVSLALLILFAGKILLTSAPQQMHNIPTGDSFQRTPHAHHATTAKYDLKHIYKLGYDDAKSGSEFGTSFPKDIINKNAAEESLPVQDSYDDEKDYDWAYNPPLPSPPRSKSNLGVGTLLSAFALYRFGKDVITTPNGQVVFDPQYIVTRLRSIEPWRIGIMIVSLYRVVKALISFF